MKKLFFGRKKLKKSQSVQHEKSERVLVNGGSHLQTSRTFDQPTAGTSRDSTFDDYHSFLDGASSSLGEEHHFDEELDKHMMQTISDVKYTKRRAKFVAVGEVNFQRQCLDAHNLIRAKYGCQPLIWSQELSDLAHTWAVKLAERGRILYPELPGIGENIRLSLADEQTHLPSGVEVTDFWADEAENFDFERPRWHPSTQHFTQVVWKETFEMGIARCWNTSKNCVAIVAFYRPAGNSNAPGEFQVNVPSKASLEDLPLSSSTPLRFVVSAMQRSMTLSDSAVQSPARASTGPMKTEL
uniref:SCP domain-containing protein n=1 Tax=Parascaris univalens TaxID=6257 RepID=A0A914ZJC6_PARUN